MWPLALASTVGVLAQMGSPQGTRTPAPRLGFDLMKVRVLISGLARAVDAAMELPTRPKTKSPAAKSSLLHLAIDLAFGGNVAYCC